MKKIMFYCQYLAGMGHLVRSTEIIRSLVKQFQVCFVNGGQPIEGFEFPTGIEVFHLPPILEEAGQIQAVDSAESIETVKTARKNQLLNIFDRVQPDCLIIECFPFSKHKLKFELIPLLDYVKASSRPVQVVCSLRDLIMTQTQDPAAREKRFEKICDWVNRYFDLVLVHSDPALVCLNEQFPKVDWLNCQVYYTGYVVQTAVEQVALSPDDQSALSSEAPMIVVSAGGGRFGYELMNSVIAASKILESQIPHQFHLFTGPFMPEAQIAALQAAASSPVVIRRYTSQLIQYLERADLSISLGGYNTTMNILGTGVRSLIFPEAGPEQAGEQTIRSEKLAAKGILGVLYRADLQPDRLAEKILNALQQQPLPHRFDLQGADRSAFRLKELLEPIAIAA